MSNISRNNTNGICTHTGSLHVIPQNIVVAIYIFILSFNIIGNTIVAIVVTFHRKMQTFTNWMILNLSLADLALGVVCIPLEIPLELNNGNWIYGKVICTLLYPLQTATVFASVFTLTVLSFSRYRAIVCPLYEQPRKTHAKIVIVVIWFASLIMVTPYMAVLQIDTDTDSECRKCGATWSSSAHFTYSIISFTLQYALPLLVMTITYSLVIYDVNFKKSSLERSWSRTSAVVCRENRKLTKLLVALALIFFVCGLPFQMVVFIIPEFFRSCSSRCCCCLLYVSTVEFSSQPHSI